ncbi:MAG: type VII secretion protein EccB, partial [Angustibacter sp.]
TAAGPAQQPRLSLLVGPEAPGQRLALEDGKALVVKVGERLSVVTDGRRFRVRGKDPEAVLRALGLDGAPGVPVAAGWLTALPAGPDLAYPSVPGRGQRSGAVPGLQLRVGQVLEDLIAGSTTPRFQLVLRDGLAPLSVVQARLVLGDPRSVQAYDGQSVAPVPITPAQEGGARVSSTDLDRGAYPAVAPEVFTFQTGGDVVLCATPKGFRSGVPGMVVALHFGDAPVTPGGRAVQVDPQTGTPDATGDGQLADTVVIAPGKGALVRTAPAQGVTNGPIYLVTDLGIRYAVPDAEAQKALGYGAAQPAPMPSVLVDLLIAGPVLDRQAAAQVVSPAAG